MGMRPTILDLEAFEKLCRAPEPSPPTYPLIIPESWVKGVKALPEFTEEPHEGDEVYDLAIGYYFGRPVFVDAKIPDFKISDQNFNPDWWASQ